MRGLPLGIGLRDLRSWFAQSKAELAEQPLTLAHFQLHAQFTTQKRRQRRAVPHRCGQAELGRMGAKCLLHPRQLIFVQATGPARTLAFGQAGQPVRLKALHPVYHRAGRIAQYIGDLWTGHALSHEEHAVESVIVA